MRLYGPDGAIRVDEVEPGVRVYSYCDQKLALSTVAAVRKSAPTPALKVRVRNRAVTAPADHCMLTLYQAEPRRMLAGAGRGASSLSRYDVRWMPLAELRRGDVIVLPRQMGIEAESTATIPDGTEVDEDVAWLLGLAVGDGSMSGDRQLQICVYGATRDRASAVISERWGSRPTFGDKYGLRVGCKRLVVAMTKMGMRRPGHEKRVPEAVWRWSESLRRSFLDGYCTADGHRPARAKEERTYASASRQLLEDVRALHIMQNDPASNICTSQRTEPIFIRGKQVRNARDLHTLSVWRTNRGNEARLRQIQGRAAWLDAGDFTATPVLAVEPQPDAPAAWDVTVREAGNYVADGVVMRGSMP